MTTSIISETSQKMSDASPIANASKGLLIDPIFSTEAIHHFDKTAPANSHAAEQNKLKVSLQDKSWRISQAAKTNMPLVLGDMLTMSLCYAIPSTLMYLLAPALTSLPEILYSLLSINFTYAIIFAILGGWRSSGINPVVELKHQITSAVFAHAFYLVYLAFSGEIIASDVLTIAISCVLSCSVMYFTRFMLRLFLSQFKWWGERVVIVGASNESASIINFLSRSTHRGLRPVGIVDNLMNFSVSNNKPEMYLGEISNLRQIISTYRANWCIACINDRPKSEVNEIMDACERVSNVVIISNRLPIPTLWSCFHEFAGYSGIYVNNKLLCPLKQSFKRTVDILVSGGVLLMISPLVFLYALAIKVISPGPIFYGQKRMGRHNSIIKVWKLRSMVPNADRVLHEYLSKDPALKLEWEVEHKLKNDPRIIPYIGKFIRKSSLDELPQLWNVFVGEMSLVGPRPIVDCPDYDAVYINDFPREYAYYQAVRPGITGLWQVSGRNYTIYEDRIRMDAYYVRNWSPWLDYFILLRTVRTILFREGAY